MLPGKYNEFWKGIRYNIPLCCIVWFVDVHCTMRYKERKEYQNRMSVMTNNAGVILCPACVDRAIRSRPLSQPG